MTMSIARLSAQSGLKYLFKTTMLDDLAVAPADATTYYMKAGTPQGRWLGSGLEGISRTSGDVVTESDAKALFDHAVHPDTGTPLGRARFHVVRGGICGSDRQIVQHGGLEKVLQARLGG